MNARSTAIAIPACAIDLICNTARPLRNTIGTRPPLNDHWRALFLIDANLRRLSDRP
jgi:hypothetical protein